MASYQFTCCEGEDQLLKFAHLFRSPAYTHTHTVVSLNSVFISTDFDFFPFAISGQKLGSFWLALGRLGCCNWGRLGGGVRSRRTGHFSPTEALY